MNVPSLEFGSCLYVFDPAAHGSENCLLKCPVMLSGWKGTNSSTGLLVKTDRISHLCRFENVTISERQVFFLLFFFFFFFFFFSSPLFFFSLSLKSDKKGKEFDQPSKRAKGDENEEDSTAQNDGGDDQDDPEGEEAGEEDEEVEAQVE